MRKAKNRLHRLIEFVLKHETQLRNAVFEARNDHVPSGNGKSKLISDTTGEKAIALCTPIPKVIVNGESVFNPEKWILFCDILYRNVTGIQGRLLTSRYRKNEGYVMFCAKEKAMDQNKYQRLLNDLRTYATMLAIELRLVSITEEKYFNNDY